MAQRDQKDWREEARIKFAKRFAQLLEQKGWTVDDVIRHGSAMLTWIGCNSYRTGARFPDPPRAVPLAAALDMTVEEMLGPVKPPREWWAKVEAIRQAIREGGAA